MGDSKQPEQTPAQAQQIQNVDDPIHIMALIQRMVNERLFVTVALSDGEEHYNSTVLRLEQEDGVFLLDELYPENGNAVLLEQGWLRLSARFDHASITFTAQIRGTGEEAGIRFFRVELPARVDYAQRRSRFRVPVDSLQDVPVMLETASGESTLGSLHDISANGLSIVIAAEGSPRLEVGDPIPYCVVRLPGEAPVVGEAEIRDVRSDEGGHAIVGARFVAIERQVQQRIERFVADAERELLKRRSGDDL